MALCLGIVLSYPAAWRRRISGALTGIVTIVGLNAVRIATLCAIAGSPGTLRLLHVLRVADRADLRHRRLRLALDSMERAPSRRACSHVARFFKYSAAGLVAHRHRALGVFKQRPGEGECLDRRRRGRDSRGVWR